MSEIHLWLCDVKNGEQLSQPLLDIPFTGVRIGLDSKFINLHFRAADKALYCGATATYATLLTAFQHALVDAKLTGFTAALGFQFTGYAKFGQYKYTEGHTIKIVAPSGEFSTSKVQWIIPDALTKPATVLILATDANSTGSTSTTVGETEAAIDEKAGSTTDSSTTNPGATPNEGNGGAPSDGGSGITIGSGEFTSSFIIRGLGQDLDSISASLNDLYNYAKGTSTTDPNTGVTTTTPDKVTSGTLDDILAMAAQFASYTAMLASVSALIIQAASVLFQSVNVVTSLMQSCAISKLLSLADLQVFKDMLKAIGLLETGAFMQGIRSAVNWVSNQVANLGNIIKNITTVATEAVQKAIDKIVEAVKTVRSMIAEMITKAQAMVQKFLDQVNALLSKMFSFLNQMGFMSGLLNCARAFLAGFGLASVVISKINPTAGATLRSATEARADLDSGAVTTDQQASYTAQKLDEQMNVTGTINDSSVVFAQALADINSMESTPFIPPLAA